MSFGKNFAVSRLHESWRLHIRAEFFNFFNHTHLNNPFATVNVSTFGLAFLPVLVLSEYLKEEEAP